MRVIFVLPDLPRSGVATRTVGLAEHLACREVAVDIVTFLPAADPGLQARLWQPGIRMLPLRQRASAQLLRRTLRSERDTVIHAATPTAGLLGLVLARCYRRPLVYSYTNSLHSYRPFQAASLANWTKAELERVLARRCEALHAVSGGVAAQVARSYPSAAGRVHAVVGSESMPVGDAASLGGPADRSLPGGYPRLLAIGRLTPHKRFGDTVRAMPAIRRRWPSACLAILGSGSELDSLRRLARDLGVAEATHIPGEAADPRPHLEWADFLVHPSLYEGYPRVAAEASALRLPVITVDTPYGREIRQRGGAVRLARPCDPDALARAVAEAAGEKKPCPGPVTTQNPNAQMHDLYRSLLSR